MLPTAVGEEVDGLRKMMRMRIWRRRKGCPHLQTSSGRYVPLSNQSIQSCQSLTTAGQVDDFDAEGEYEEERRPPARHTLNADDFDDDNLPDF